MKLQDAIIAAFSGDLKEFDRLLNPATSGEPINLLSESLQSAIINCPNPSKAILIFIKYRAEPTEDEIKRWLKVAVQDGCAEPIEQFAGLLLRKNQNLQACIKFLNELCNTVPAANPAKTAVAEWIADQL